MVESKQEFKEKELIKVSKINILVHPGFAADPNFLNANPKDFRDEMQEEDKLGLSQALNKYIPVAEKMGQDELMLAFLHKPFKMLIHDKVNKDDYLQIIEKLKQILGDRLIVFSSEFPVQTEDEEGVKAAGLSFGRAIEIAKGRGYQLEKGVEAKALGEFVDSCVSNGLINFRQSKVVSKKSDLLRDHSL